MSSLEITIIVVVFLLVISVSIWYAKRGIEEKPEPVVYPTKRSEHSQLELDILAEINKVRQDESLDLLKLNDIVSISCKSHIDMCRRVGKISHTDVGHRFSDLKHMLSPVRLGEVVAYGYRDAKGVVNGFLKSPEHKKILLGDFNQMGISAQMNSDDKMYVGIIAIKVK